MEYVKDRNEWQALVYKLMIEFQTTVFVWFLCSLVAYHLARGVISHWQATLVAYHLARSVMPSHDVVVVNCKNFPTIKAQVPSQWAKVCVT